MTRWIAILVVLGSGILIGEERVTIHLPKGSVYMAGSEVVIQCRVTRSPDNRRLRIGIPYHRLTAFDLDGKRAPFSHQFVVKELPCSLPVTVAVCQLTTYLGSILASKPLTVGGCS